jgi:hypothetical protein
MAPHNPTGRPQPLPHPSNLPATIMTPHHQAFVKVTRMRHKMLARRAAAGYISRRWRRGGWEPPAALSEAWRKSRFQGRCRRHRGFVLGGTSGFLDGSRKRPRRASARFGWPEARRRKVSAASGATGLVLAAFAGTARCPGRCALRAPGCRAGSQLTTSDTTTRGAHGPQGNRSAPLAIRWNLDLLEKRR